MIAAASVPPIFRLLVCLAVAGGAWMLWTGFRGRRVGDAPSCGRCRYSVAGISSDICPECGADLTRPNGILFGQCVRRAKRGVLGILTILLASLVLTAARSEQLRNYDWYTHAPMRWVLADLAGPQTPQRVRAWKELNRRMRLYGPLSKEEHDRLVTIALVEQVAPPAELKGGYTVTQGLLDWLEDESVHDRLTYAQRTTFLENALVATLWVKQHVAAGQPVSFQIRLDSGGGGIEYGRFSRIDALSVSVDGGPPKTLQRNAAGSGLGHGSLILSNLPLDAPGRHDLAFTLHVQVLTLPGNTKGIAAPGTVQHEYELTLKEKVEVGSAER